MTTLFTLIAIVNISNLCITKLWIVYLSLTHVERPVLASALLGHFSYTILCVDTMMNQCTAKKWFSAKTGRIPVKLNTTSYM